MWWRGWRKGTRITNRISFCSIFFESSFHPTLPIGGLSHTRVLIFFIVEKSGAHATQHFSANTEYEIVKWVAENAEIPVYNANRRCVSACDEGRKKAICLPGANRILIRYYYVRLIAGQFGRETKYTPSLQDGKTRYLFSALDQF